MSQPWTERAQALLDEWEEDHDLPLPLAVGRLALTLLKEAMPVIDDATYHDEAMRGLEEERDAFAAEAVGLRAKVDRQAAELNYLNKRVQHHEPDQQERRADELEKKMWEARTERDALAAEVDRLYGEILHRQAQQEYLTQRLKGELSSLADANARSGSRRLLLHNNIKLNRNNAALRAALKQYGIHARTCNAPASRPDGTLWPCTCGLDAALEEKP